jgi:hypothetical protein
MRTIPSQVGLFVNRPHTLMPAELAETSRTGQGA